MKRKTFGVVFPFCFFWEVRFHFLSHPVYHKKNMVGKKKSAIKRFSNRHVKCPADVYKRQLWGFRGKGPAKTKPIEVSLSHCRWKPTWSCQTGGCFHRPRCPRRSAGYWLPHPWRSHPKQEQLRAAQHIGRYRPPAGLNDSSLHQRMQRLPTPVRA